MHVAGHDVDTNVGSMAFWSFLNVSWNLKFRATDPIINLGKDFIIHKQLGSTYEKQDS